MALHDCYQLFHGFFMFFLDLNPQPSSHLSLLKGAREMWMCADESLRNIRSDPSGRRLFIERWAVWAASISSAGDDMPYPLFCLTSCCSVHRNTPAVPDRSNVEPSAGLSILTPQTSFLFIYCAFCKTLNAVWISQNLSRTCPKDIIFYRTINIYCIVKWCRFSLRLFL